MTTLPENLGTSLRTQIVIEAPNLIRESNIDNKIDIQTQVSNLREFIKENESHVLNIKGDGSKVSEYLEADQISVSSNEHIGTSMKEAIFRLK